jgi:hypothetical protein
MMNSSRRPLCMKRKSKRRSQRGGGNGYRLDPQLEAIAGQAVVMGYDSRVPPIFNGELMKGGKRKKRRSSKRKSYISKRR